MGNQSKQDQGTQKQMNDYEKAKLLRVKQNQERLRELGVVNIANSLTSLVQSKKTTTSKRKTSSNEKDADYMPDYDGDGEEHYNEEIKTSAGVPTKRPQYIAPMSMNRYANLAKKKRVIAPNVSCVLPLKESCIRNAQSVDFGASQKSNSKRREEGQKRNGLMVGKSVATEKQSTVSMTTADVILKKKETAKQSGAVRQNLTKPNSSGARRKLFLVDEDNDDDNPTSEADKEQDGAEFEYEDVDAADMEQDGAEYEDEDMDGAEYEDMDGAEYEDEDVDGADMEQDGAEYEDEDHINELDNEYEELMVNQHEGPGANETDARNVNKRVRGPTRMKKIWGESEIIKVQFNEYGQPIDKKKTSQLTHFMGAVARGGKYCPIYKPWHKVSDKKKQALLKLLKSKFDLPSSAHDWILASFAKKVRNWRARLKEYHDPSLPLQEQINSMPERVHERHWKRLVKFWNKDSTKKLSEKNKESRAKKKMVQVTGKKSYARVREELKETSGCEPSRMEMFRACFSKDGTTKNKAAKKAIKRMQHYSSQLPEGSVDKPGPEDTFSKVIPNDKNGLARMFGLGVRASDVWGVIPSRSACRRENAELKIRNEQLEAEVARFKGKESEGEEREGSIEHGEAGVALRVGAEVYLRNILNSTEIVAKGRIKSLDPDEHVGGEEIGPGWCEVNIQVPVKRSARLVRPSDLHVTIEDAVGATTAWPCTFVSVMREDDA